MDDLVLAISSFCIDLDLKYEISKGRAGLPFEDYHL
jgi:hypothetical protein